MLYISPNLSLLLAVLVEAIPRCTILAYNSFVQMFVSIYIGGYIFELRLNSRIIFRYELTMTIKYPKENFATVLMRTIAATLYIPQVYLVPMIAQLSEAKLALYFLLLLWQHGFLPLDTDPPLLVRH